MTHRDFRYKVGADIARRVIVGCCLRVDSLRQKDVMDRTIPAVRRLCLADALETLAANLLNIARELRAEDEP